jgi:hypothetical protein
MGIAALHPSYGDRREVDVGAQFIAPAGTQAHSEGAMNRAATVGQIIRAVKAHIDRERCRMVGYAADG